MIFTETTLAGAFVVDVERHADARGSFARTFCRREFDANGLDSSVVQASVSYNESRGTLRGMHFQYPPAAETKLVRCSRGFILDVIVDLRPESPTYLQHLAVELSSESGRALYIPKRFAHGFQVLADQTEVTYLMGEFYAPDLAGGLPFDDPRLGIVWPLPASDVSDRDRAWPRLEQCGPALRARMSLPPGDQR